MAQIAGYGAFRCCWRLLILNTQKVSRNREKRAYGASVAQIYIRNGAISTEDLKIYSTVIG